MIIITGYISDIARNPSDNHSPIPPVLERDRNSPADIITIIKEGKIIHNTP
jgi:hypothetical protein